MKRSEKIKESQYLWEFERNVMIHSNKARYSELIEVMDPLFKRGIVTYDEWMDYLEEVFSKYSMEHDVSKKSEVPDEVIKEITKYYKQFNIK